MEYFGFGEYEFGSKTIIESMRRGISGTHRLNGMWLLWGGPVKAKANIEGAQITDLAPTILYLMGESVPSDMDGRVLTEALAPEYTALHPIAESVLTEADAPTTSTTPDEDLSEADEELIAQRLRGLGYVG
jgi:hypothetical protein